MAIIDRNSNGDLRIYKWFESRKDAKAWAKGKTYGGRARIEEKDGGFWVSIPYNPAYV